MSKGCRVLLIVGGVLALIVVAGIILSFIYCKQISTAIINKTIDAFEEKVLSDLPEGFDPDEVKTQFANFKRVMGEQVRKGSPDQAKIQQLTQRVQKALEDEKIDADELQGILDAMKDFAGEQ